MSTVVAVCGGKGGCGRTSVTVNLGMGLARRGKRVIVVDLDATRHLSTWLLGPGGTERLSERASPTCCSRRA